MSDLKLLFSHDHRIETQDVLFGQENIDRLIEIGPTNTLAAMAKKTLAARYSIADAARPRKREILCHQSDAEKIYGGMNDDVAQVAPPKAEETNSSNTAKKEMTTQSKPTGTAVPQVQQPEIAAPVPQQTIVPVAPVAEIPDVTVSAGDILIAIISSKLKKPFHEIDTSRTIKALTGGKRTPYNFCHAPKFKRTPQPIVASSHCSMKQNTHD